MACLRSVVGRPTARHSRTPLWTDPTPILLDSPILVVSFGVDLSLLCLVYKFEFRKYSYFWCSS